LVTVTDFVAADDDILVTPSNDGLNLAVTVNGTGLDDGVLDETSMVHYQPGRQNHRLQEK